jgi:hypothetical protein
MDEIIDVIWIAAIGGSVLTLALVLLVEGYQCFIDSLNK